MFSPAALGEFIIAAVVAFALHRPHVVAPSIATAAALFAAASRPDRFATLTVGPGPALVPLAVGPDLRGWTHMDTDTDTVDNDLSRPRARVIELLSHIQRHELEDEVREDYLRSYDGDRLTGTHLYWRRLRHELPALVQLLPKILVPTLIIAGRQDRLIPWRNAEFLHQSLPGSQLSCVDAGHFVWEDAAEQYAVLVRDWWEEYNSP
ncbi:alpha/beta fold hydrolase [Mycobacterium sp. 1245852.3]|uniref:alpha/beta fold hydrolase n=1 Tax=Mycobacterium sp. 1245852.3 TaxID=1856860 RepID=UPI001E45057C|nr:alpha/beta hydrolase [Mycobacterium sp. 1245852.3]